MNMEKFIYNPDKSRARSRSPISNPNPSNQLNDKLNPSKSVKDLSANKQPDQIIYRESPTLRGASKPQEERKRSNSPLVSNYKSNDLNAFEKKEISKAENVNQPMDKEKNINDRQRSNSPLVSEYKSNNRVLEQASQLPVEKQNVRDINTNRQRSNSPLVSEYKSNNLKADIKLISPVFPGESSNIKIQPKGTIEREISKSPMAENKKANERSRSPIFENKVNYVQITTAQNIQKTNVIQMEGNESNYASRNENTSKINNERERSISRNRQPIFGEMNKSANNSFVEIEEVVHERKTSNAPQRSHSPVIKETKSVSKSYLATPVNKENKKIEFDLQMEENKINAPKITEKQVVKKYEENPKTFENHSNDRQRSNSPFVSEYKTNNLNTQKNVILKTEEMKQAEIRERNNNDRQRSNSPLVSEYKPNFLNSGIDIKNNTTHVEKGIIHDNNNMMLNPVF